MTPVLDDATIRAAAAELHAAERGRGLVRPFSARWPAMTAEDAYGIQDAWMRLKLEEGRSIKGRKIGLTSRAMQLAVGIDEPDHGVLLDDMVYQDGAVIPDGRFLAPRIEVELAFILARPLAGPDCSLFDVLNATDFVTPALEILDRRMHHVDPETNTPRRVVDTIADNASNAALVLGGRPFRPLEGDMRWIAALCYRNGQIEESGVAAAVLNHPANGIAWLANKLAPHGQLLEAGQVVLAGSFTRPVEARPGDTFNVDYGPYGSVSCHFARSGSHEGST